VAAVYITTKSQKYQKYFKFWTL